MRSPFESSKSLSIQELWRVMPTKEIYIIERKELGLALHFHKLADPHTLEISQLPFFVFLLSLHSYRSPKMFSFIFVALNTPKFRFTQHTKIDLSNCASSNSSMMIRIDWILISMSFLSTSIASREELDYASMKFQQRTEIEIRMVMKIRMKMNIRKRQSIQGSNLGEYNLFRELTGIECRLGGFSFSSNAFIGCTKLEIILAH